MTTWSGARKLGGPTAVAAIHFVLLSLQDSKARPRVRTALPRDRAAVTWRRVPVV